MNAIDAVDDLVREYLLFRGFHGTLKQFDADVKNDAARGFQVDRLLEHLMSLLQNYELQAMLDFWYYLDSRFFSRLEQSFLKAVKRFELDLLRLYLVNAMQHSRKDKVHEFFELYSTELASSPEWSAWFVLPFTRRPELDSAFEAYFSKSWIDTFVVSLHNFMVTVFQHLPLPGLLAFNVDRLRRKALEAEVASLRHMVDALKAELLALESADGQAGGAGRPGAARPAGADVAPAPSKELAPAPTERGETDAAPSGFAEDESIMLLSQDVYSAHESPISLCRFSAEGALVASVDTENVLRIWSPSALSSSSLSATVARQQTSMQVNALEWEAKSDRLLLLGGEDQRVRVFSTESRAFVSDIPLETEYARVTQLACNPVDPVFMASMRPASTSRARDGCLVLLNLRTMKQQYVLRLEPEKVAMTAMRFNHNGQLLVAGDINGVVRIMDVQSFSSIMEWQAHTCEVLSVQFSFDETSVYSLGADGVLAQWSVHRIGTKLSEVHVDGFDAGHARSVAFDGEGAFMLSSTNRNFATLNETSTGVAVRTLSGHQGPITAVDISPVSFTTLTGSTDRTLRVCKLLRV